MKESLKEVARINNEHLSGITCLLTELKADKVWAGEYKLQIENINEKFRILEDRLREGNDKFRDLERQIREKK